MNSSLNCKILLPVQPFFLLELCDIMYQNVSDQVRIVVISESANSVIQYSNINLDYLNVKLQEKIYHTENPLSFDKLIKANRLKIFRNIEEYLNSKKVSVNGINMIPNDYSRELFITTHESLRLGDSAYLFQNLNMQIKAFQRSEPKIACEFSVILTDPLLGNSSYQDDLFMKPFAQFNSINIFRCPISASIACSNAFSFLKFLSAINPKRVLCGTKCQEYL